MINKLVLIAHLIFVASCANAEIRELPFGGSVSLNQKDHKVIIDYRFIKDITEQPSIKRVTKNFWEFIYFINLGDLDALNVGIDILSQELPKDIIHDKYGYQYIARAVSQNDEFWYVLYKKKLPVIKSVLEYFEKYPDQYENMEGFSFMKNKLLEDKKK